MTRYGEGDRRRGADEGLARRTRSRPRSPVQRQRATAADFFEDDHEDQDHDHRSQHHRRSRSHSARSRSPGPDDGRHEQKRLKRTRGHHDDHHHHHHRQRRRHGHGHGHHSSTTTRDPPPAELPFDARPLSYKHDFEVFTPLFAYYLDIQKGHDFYALDSHEAKGRWKSFVNKWNSGKLAEGWYEPETFQRVTKENPARMNFAHDEEEEDNTAVADEYEDPRRGSDGEEAGADAPAEIQHRSKGKGQDKDDNNDEDDDEDYGPPPPPDPSSVPSGGRKGPGIPTLSDLALQREAAADSAQSDLAALRLARKADRAEQKERLDEIVPRAAAGTRERQLEKKALVNEKMRSFRDKAGDTMEEVGDGELMGGGVQDDIAEYKRMLASQQRKKTDRELRREAEARARAEEREERLKEWREREEEKLKGLKELARARFG